MIRIRAFLVLILLLALIPLAAFNVIAYRQNLDRQRRLILRRHLETAETVAIGFREFVFRVIRTSQVIGLAITRDDLDEEAAAGFLRQASRAMPSVRSIALLSPTGRRVAATRRGTPPPPESSVAAIRRGRPWTVSDIQPLGRLHAQFHITVGMREGGRLRGMIDSVITDRAVLRRIAVRIGERGNLGIIDRTGRALILTFRPNLPFDQRSRLFVPSIRSALRGKPATVREFHDPLGVDRMGASVPVPDIGWVSNVFQPVDEALAPVRRQAAGQAALSFVVSLLSLGLVLVLSRVITGPVSELAEGTRPFARGEFDRRVRTDFRIVEFNELATAFNTAAGEIQLLFEAERHIGETLQASLVGGELPEIPGFELGTHYASATEMALVGGDFFDVLPLGGTRFGVVIGDIEGQGIEAAVSTATVKFALGDLADRYADPADVVTRLNRAFYSQEHAERFVTLIYAALDVATGVLRMVNAGHPPLIMCGAETCREVGDHGMAVGTLPDNAYLAVETQIMPDEVIVLYTDGVLEARHDGELFGDERLKQVIQAHSDRPASTIANRIYEECLAFTGGRLLDDMAIMVLKRKK